MAQTQTLNSTYDALASMDKQIADAEAHLRVLKTANFPGAIKLESDLAKAKAQRKDLMDAIQQEMNR